MRGLQGGSGVFKEGGDTLGAYQCPQDSGDQPTEAFWRTVGSGDSFTRWVMVEGVWG